MKGKKLTFKNFGLGLLAVFGLPLWFPVFAMAILIGALCEVGQYVNSLMGDEGP